MKREAGLLMALVMVLALLSATAQLIVAQDQQSKSGPALPPGILGPQLIAWSQLQRLQPVQLPRAARQKESTAQAFTGTIVEDGSSYVLKVSTNSAYQLAEQETAKKYAGKQVRISGILDASGESLHIISIELVS
jgi:hypothetical protein